LSKNQESGGTLVEWETAWVHVSPGWRRSEFGERPDAQKGGGRFGGPGWGTKNFGFKKKPSEAGQKKGGKKCKQHWFVARNEASRHNGGMKRRDVAAGS